MKRQVKAFNENRTFGVEIEFTVDRNEFRNVQETIASVIREMGVSCHAEGYNHRTVRHWKVITDSSCGYEIVSPPLKGREGMKELKIVCEVLNTLGVKVNRSCGVHVHHDINDYSIKEMKNLYATYIKFENVLDSFQPRSRRGNNNQYCRSFGDTPLFKNNKLRKIKECNTVQELVNVIGTRYVKLNLQSYVKYGTVEFRHHAGSTDFEKISNWIMLTQQMVDNAMERMVSFEFTKKWDSWAYFSDVMNMTKAKGATEEIVNVLKFYKKRAAQLAA